MTTSSLYRLEREQFVQAVTGHAILRSQRRGRSSPDIWGTTPADSVIRRTTQHLGARVRPR